MPDILFFRNMAILAKNEVTEGTDPVPTGAANAILAVDAQITPFNAKTAQRNLVRPYMGAQAELSYGQSINLQFKTEMQGSGTQTVVPAYGPLLRSGGLAQTQFPNTGNGTIGAAYTAGVGTVGAFTYTRTTAYAGNQGRDVTLTCTTGGASGVAAFHVTAPAAGNEAAYDQAGAVMTAATPFDLGGGAQITPTAVTTDFQVGDVYTIRVDPPRTEYTPISDAFESSTLYFYLDSILHKGLGARCELGWTVQSGIPYFTYSFNGLYVAPADAALPTVDFSAFPDPLVAEAVNTPVVSLYGNTVPLTSFSGQFGNKVDPRILVNQQNVPLRGRSVSGAALFDMTKVATYDWFGAVANGTKGKLAFQHGNAAGSIVRIDAPQIQIKNPRYQNIDDGVVGLNLDMLFVPTSAGNDEIKLTVC